MSYTATNFKEWYEDKYLKDKGEFDKLAPDDQKKIKEEFGNFDDVLKYMDKSYAEYKGFNDDARKKYDDIAVSLLGKNDDDRSQLLEQAKKNLTPDISSGKAEKSDDTNEDTNWIKKKIESWNNNWCQDKDIHDPEYTFDRITEDVPDTQLKFNIYKDAGKTQLGATIHYTSKTNVTLETEEGKVPDFEFFDKMIHEAVQDGAPAVNFANADEMTDDFKAKLAIACLKHGIQMEGFDGNVDLKKHLKTEEWDKLPEKTKKEIEFHDAKRAAKEMKEAGHEMTIDSDTDKSTAAIIYAACKEVGISVKGLENFTKDSHGMFTLPAKEKELLPKEVQSAIAEHNDQTFSETLTNLRGTLKTDTTKMTPEELGLYNERQQAEKARKTLTFLRKKALEVLGSTLKGIDGKPLDPANPDDYKRVNLSLLSDVQLALLGKAIPVKVAKDNGINTTSGLPPSSIQVKKAIKDNSEILNKRGANRKLKDPTHKDFRVLDSKGNQVKDDKGNLKFKSDTTLLKKITENLNTK